MTPFIQYPNQPSTMDGWQSILADNDWSSFAAFAYVTDSGVSQLNTYLSQFFTGARDCRWVFAFDYGRTQPTALKRLSDLGYGDIRIYDGDYVVTSPGFAPRESFHLKTAFTLRENNRPNKQLVGSGNLSAAGLLTGIEAGCVVDYLSLDQNFSEAASEVIESIWDRSTPFAEVLEEYENNYQQDYGPKQNQPVPAPADDIEMFWIDVGYVTKNRGPNRPGNQFDLPRGSHVYLGIDHIPDPALNTVLGEIDIRTPSGEVLTRSLRHGNNSMEKLTLPIPETHGYHCYDGKILTFVVRNGDVVLEAFEYADFMRLYGAKITKLEEMRSGRTYGTISIKG